MITAISVKNIRGVCRSLSIRNRLTLFTGENGAGKSTMLDAVNFAINGTINGQSAKDNELWSSCATDSEMMAGIMSDRSGICRYLTKEKGTVSHHGHIGSSGPTVKKAALNALVGQLDIQVVDQAGFWQLSDAKQIQALAAYYQGEEYSLERIKGRFNGQFLTKAIGPTPFELLDQIQERVKSLKSDYTATAKSAEGTITAIAGQLAEIERPAGTLHAIEQEIKSLQQTAAQIRANLTKAGQDKANREAWEKETEATTARMAEIQAQAPEDGLKTVQVYEWEMNRCRDEKAKALVEPDHQLMEFAQKVLAGMEKAGCECCPVSLLPKMQIKASTPKTVDLKALEAEFNHFKGLRSLAEEYQRLELKSVTLSNDSRSHIDTSSETAQAADGIATSIQTLQAQKEAIQRHVDLQASIETTRSAKVAAEEGVEECKKAEKALAEIRKGMIAAVFAPVTEAVNRYLPSGTAVFKVEDGHLFLGWNLEGRENATPRVSLSGGEKARFDPAMALGLLSLAGDNGQKVLLIEAAEMSRTSLREFCAALAKADSGVQVIAAAWSDSEAPISSIDGWDVIQLTYSRLQEAT